MKKSFVCVAGWLALSLISVQAQPGRPGPMGGGMAGGPHGTQFSPHMAKLFGDNPMFSATLENHLQSDQGETVMPGKIAFDNGKSRFEMNMADMKGPQANPQQVSHLKAMGMDEMIMISRPDTKISYIVCPGLHAYAESPIQDPEVGKSSSDFKVDTTELGKETVDGHPCIKNKVVVTDDKGEKHESTVWNATDLKKFPVKIETTERGAQVTLLFKNVTLGKPAASQFEAPSDFQKYDSMQAMMQAEMMKRMGGGHPGMPGMGGMGGPPQR
jgi:hypothetical protein